MEKALRYGEVLASKEVAREGLKIAEEEFEKKGKEVNELTIKGEKLIEEAIKNAETDSARKEFEDLRVDLKALDEVHSEYEKSVVRIFELIARKDFMKPKRLLKSQRRKRRNLISR